MLIGVVYNNHSQNDITDLIQTITEISEQYSFVVLMGDFNLNLMNERVKSALELKLSGKYLRTTFHLASERAQRLHYWIISSLVIINVWSLSAN